MQLLIVRHAPAEDRAEAAARGCPDARRVLTPRGRRRMERAVHGMVALGLRGDVLWHSPWTRATRTAGLLAPIVGSTPRTCAALARAPDDRLLAALARMGDVRVVLVGHQPWLGELIAWLTDGTRADGAGPQLGKGAVACLAGRPEPGGMELFALLPSRVLRAVGRAKHP